MNRPYFQNEYCRCFDIFTPEEQEILLRHRNKYFPLLLRYWGKYFPGNTPDYRERRLIGKCPLTPEEVLILLIDIVPDVCV
jgi:hypothetical protein